MSIANRSYQQGFTFLELFITVALMGLILASAVPNLSAYVERRQVTASAQGISDMLSLARGQAVARAAITNVCWNEDDADRTEAGSSETLVPGEFIVWTMEGGDVEVLKRVQFSANNFLDADDVADQCVTFDRFGRSNLAANNGFYVCRRENETNGALEVQLDLAGRAQVSTAESGDTSCT